VIVQPEGAAIADAIDRLLADPAERRRMAGAARLVAATRGWEDRVADMERVYAELIEQRGSRKARGAPALADPRGAVEPDTAGTLR